MVRDIKKDNYGGVNMIIKREKTGKINLADGFYAATIQRVDVKTEKSRFSADGERVALNLFIQVEHGMEKVVLCSLVTANLSPKSKLTQLLDDLGMLPSMNGDFDTDSLIGMFVTVLLENVVRNGATYTNVVKIKKRMAQVAV
jgi:hypothetical protein